MSFLSVLYLILVFCWFTHVLVFLLCKNNLCWFYLFIPCPSLFRFFLLDMLVLPLYCSGLTNSPLYDLAVTQINICFDINICTAPRSLLAHSPAVLSMVESGVPIAWRLY